MSERKSLPVIRLRGVRHNNLKNFDLDLPLNRLIVITGLSGSGKSSLAFDTLFAEGQRRYIETFSPYARQFFDRMDKPQVDTIEGIPPAIAIEQRNAVRTTRSTVGTMTEICDYMKVLWPHIAQLHCRQCGQPVRKDSPQRILEALQSSSSSFSSSSSKLSEQKTDDEDEGRERGGIDHEVLITFDLPLSEKLSLEESLALIAKQGYQRLLLNGEIVRLDEVASRLTPHASRLTVIQDRVKLTPANRARFIEACEQAYHFGKGKLAIHSLSSDSTFQRLNNSTLRFSNRLHCAQCDLEYREPSPALFSFNHPVGACPGCKGFGRIITIDYDLAIPDRSKTLAEGAVKPWQVGHGLESQRDLMKFCRACDIRTDVPFEKLPKKTQDWVINGDKDYGIDEEHEWPRAWYGVKGYFRWLESKSYKMHVRVLLSRYRAYTTCPECNGARLQPEALLYLLNAGQASRLSLNFAEAQAETGETPGLLSLADFYALPIRDALQLVEDIAKRKSVKAYDPLGLCLSEVRARLSYLNDVGLGYLTLDRPTRSLSGGETERVNLTTCLGTRLVNTLFVLDEPSVGLHPRDTDRLVRVLEQLRAAGNTVVVVEHEPNVMRAADQIVDLGPGHGATGGEIVFQGTFVDIQKSQHSLTGQYLSGRTQIDVPRRRSAAAGQASSLSEASKYPAHRPEAAGLNEAVLPYGDRRDACPTLRLAHATRHNLKDVSVEIPLERFVCVTGVSGSGKTTLIREVLLPALEANLKSQISNLKSLKASDRIGDQDRSDGNEENGTRNTQHAALTGDEHLSRVVLVDQSILAKTPRSNPAVYIGAFDDIREFFAQSEPAKQRGFTRCEFSYNSPQGQCERCRGAGFEKIEMQFLSDVFIRCPDCNGRRYRAHVLEVKIGATFPDGRRVAWSAADVLDATVDEVIEFFSVFRESKHARRAVNTLKLLQEVGLGYLRLGQPVNTLSGGESQRLKLVRHLADSVTANVSSRLNTSSPKRTEGQPRSHERSHTLFLFDEPTTGLHFDDVRGLLKVFQRLVDSGNSVIVIEHNLDVIKSADWVVDLGPDAGDQGGEIVAQGTPEDIAACERSHTGHSLRRVLEQAVEMKGIP